jgi:50S ribosomal subunit-associated GTPase HflX
MGEGMIPDTMSFFDDLPEQLFIAFYLVSDAKKAGRYVFFS